jgi:zinc protease
MTTPSPGLPPSLTSLFAESPEVLALENGLKVVFKQDMSHPVVSVQTWVKTGSIHEGEYLGSGLSGAIAEEVQAFGGSINAYTAFDRTVYYIDGPSEALGDILELLADQTLNASLPKEEVVKEKDVILREIDMTLDDPDRIVGRALFSTAYNDHPFRFPVIGQRALFEKVDHGVLASYYAQRYQPGNMVLSVAGCFERESLIEHLEATFASVAPSPVAPVVVPQEPLQIAHRETRLFGNYNLARGLLAYKVPSMRHEDSPALDIVAAIIGSGHSGRLRQRLREDLGLVHGISASVWNPAQPGLFFIQFQSDPEKAQAAEEAIMECCADFAEKGFTREELDKARNFAFVSEVHSRQTTSGLASRLGLVSALVGDLHYPKRYFEKIHSLTTGDLVDLARRTFQDNTLSVATLLPESCRTTSKHDASKETLPPFEEKRLANGARLYWQVDKGLPRTWIRYAGLGGPSYENIATRGSTSLMTTLLNRDTEFKSAFEIADELESEGCFISDTSGNNTFALSVEAMPESIGKGIDALRNALLHPGFKENTTQRERDAQIAYLKSLEDDILDYGRLAMRRHFFGEHPFADHPCGSIETTAAIACDDLRQLRKSLLVGPNAVLVVAGDFNPGDVLPQLESLLLELPEGQFDSPDVAFSEPAATGAIKETLDREQAVVLEAYPDVGVNPDSSLIGDLLSEPMPEPTHQQLKTYSPASTTNCSAFVMGW